MSPIDMRLKDVLIHTINRISFFFLSLSNSSFRPTIFAACTRFMSVKSSSLKTDPKMVRQGMEKPLRTLEIRCMQLAGISGFSVLSVNYGLFHGFTTTNLHYTRWKCDRNVHAIQNMKMLILT